MESVTNNEKAVIDSDGDRNKESVEPITNYFVGRVQQNLNDGNTIIGGMITSTNRDIKNGDLDFLNTSAITGGVDFMQYFKEKRYYISAKLLTSKINGSENAILEQQLSSRRYYQRSDFDYVSLDSNRTTLSGHGGNITFGKNTNSGLRFACNLTWRSPGLELNDVGYLRRANTAFHYLWVGYSITKPFSVFNKISINANEWMGWDFGGTKTFFGGSMGLYMQFKNLWSLGMNISKEGKNIDNTALRGGPAFHLPGSTSYNCNLHTNSSKKISLYSGFYINKGGDNSSNSHGLWGGISYHPINSLKISISPRYNYSNTDSQYITEEEYNSEAQYLFAGMKQETFSLTTRVDFNISPDFTIQYYASPFVSSGLFSEYKKITNPSASNLN